jgi:5-methylcytosine-specific restriction endonuclease McrA
VDEHDRAAYERNRAHADGSRPRRRIYAVILAPDPLYCALCGELIDKELPPGDPMSKTVDHITALIDGGLPLDPDNLQPAHLRCNLTKEAERRAARAAGVEPVREGGQMLAERPWKRRDVVPIIGDEP